MLKKLPWFGDPPSVIPKRTGVFTDEQRTSPSVVSQRTKSCSKPKKLKKNILPKFLLGCQSSSPYSPSQRDVVSGCAVLPPVSRSRRNVQGWFSDLCICGRRQNSCNKTFAAWRSFRKDWTGSVPVAIETLDLTYLEQRSQFLPLLDDSLAPPPYSYQFDKPHMSDNGMSDQLYNDSRIGSLETGGTNQEYGEPRGNPWCKILYWEGRDRKGSEFPVLSPTINVLGDTPHGSGLSLAALFGGPHRDDRITRTRKKICQGLVLWREGEVVWVYNRSEAPVYLNSASLDGSFYHLNLYKCPPGYAMIIYYYEMARYLMGLPEYRTRCMDKADVNSVRISFAKGWGKNYQRREILCCPCWIEVHVVPTLKVEQLTPPR